MKADLEKNMKFLRIIGLPLHGLSFQFWYLNFACGRVRLQFKYELISRYGRIKWRSI